MTREDIHELVWDYLFDKAYDEDKLFDEIQWLLTNFDTWCGYTHQDISEFWINERKRYEFGDEFIPFVIDHITLQNKNYEVEGLKITSTIKKQLTFFKNKLEEKERIK